MTTFPMQNNVPSNQSFFPPVMDSQIPPMGPGLMGRGTPSFKSINNIRLIQDGGEIKTPQPFLVYSLTSGPSGKLTVFLRRSSGTVDGGVSIYGSFKERPTSDEKVTLVENIVWTDNLTEIVSSISNPFPVLIVEYNFLGTEDITVDLNFSSF